MKFNYICIEPTHILLTESLTFPYHRVRCKCPMNGCFHHVQDRCSLDPRVVESMDTEHAGPLRVLGKQVLVTVRSMCAAPRQPPVIFLSHTHDILTRDKPHSTSHPPRQPNQSPQLSQGTPLEPHFDPSLQLSYAWRP